MKRMRGRKASNRKFEYNWEDEKYNLRSAEGVAQMIEDNHDSMENYFEVEESVNGEYRIAFIPQDCRVDSSFWIFDDKILFFSNPPWDAGDYILDETKDAIKDSIAKGHTRMLDDANLMESLWESLDVILSESSESYYYPLAKLKLPASSDEILGWLESNIDYAYSVEKDAESSFWDSVEKLWDRYSRKAVENRKRFTRLRRSTR